MNSDGFTVSRLQELSDEGTRRQLSDTLKHLYGDEMELDLLWLQKIINNHPYTSLLVVKDANQNIVGSMTAAIQMEPLQRTSAMNIGGVVVSPEARGHKLTERMLDEALEIAKSWGIKKVRLFTDETKLAAVHIYKKYGFKLDDKSSGGDQRNHYVYQIQDTPQ